MTAESRATPIPPQHDPGCWGCGDAPGGLHLPHPGREGVETYEARFRFDEGHQAGPGLAHGGLVAAVLDEACGLLATWYRFPMVTARLDVRYRRPVAINRDLIVHAWLHADRGRRVFVRGNLRDGEAVLAEARGVFAHVPLEHFLVTPEGRAVGEAWRRRILGGAS